VKNEGGSDAAFYLRLAPGNGTRRAFAKRSNTAPYASAGR
jgi:hypothetical protein